MSAYLQELHSLVISESYDWESIYLKLNALFPSLALSPEAVRLSFVHSKAEGRLESDGDLNLNDLLCDDVHASESVQSNEKGEDTVKNPFAFDPAAALEDSALTNRFDRALGRYAADAGMWDRVLGSMGGPLPVSQSSRITLPAAIPRAVPNSVPVSMLYQRPGKTSDPEAPAEEADLAQQHELEAVASAFFKQVHGYPGVGGWGDPGASASSTTNLFALDERWDDLLLGIALPEDHLGETPVGSTPSSELNQVILTLGAAAAATNLTFARKAAVSELEERHRQEEKSPMLSPSNLSSSEIAGVGGSHRSSKNDSGQGGLIGAHSHKEKKDEEKGEEEEEEVEEDGGESEDEIFLNRTALKAAAARVASHLQKGESGGGTEGSAAQKALCRYSSDPHALLGKEEEEAEVVGGERSTEEGNYEEEEAKEDEESGETLSCLTAEERDALDFIPDTTPIIPRRAKPVMEGAVVDTALGVPVEEKKEEEEEEEEEEATFTTRILISQNMGRVKS